ncbi:MAG: hypothetical protein GVY19_03335 [Bacteroidetes bacterium]|jgi:hypothetical protein|nr:hypothetical protein [Bacteroidota bacterium]
MKNLMPVIFTALLLVSCNSKHDHKSNHGSDDINKSASVTKIPTEFIDTATIIEENVWIREKPVDGEVMAKLNKATFCYVLERGEPDTIRNVADVWYKITVNDKVGWVFGSQLSIRAAKPVEFGKIIHVFMEAYNDKNVKKLDHYVHPQYGISYGFVLCGDNKPDFADVKSYPDFISFDTLQHFKSDFPVIRCNQPQKKEIPKYLGELKWEYEGCYWNEITNGQVKLVSTDNIYEFYFKAIESNWFLIRIEKIDCE